jgi:hypothetical protein
MQKITRALSPHSFFYFFAFCVDFKYISLNLNFLDVESVDYCKVSLYLLKSLLFSKFVLITTLMSHLPVPTTSKNFPLSKSPPYGTIYLKKLRLFATLLHS